jgi:hypothetical protein
VATGACVSSASGALVAVEVADAQAASTMLSKTSKLKTEYRFFIFMLFSP